MHCYYTQFRKKLNYIRSYNFFLQLFEEKSYEEPCTRIFNLKYESQKCYEFSASKCVANFRDFDIFRKYLNFKCLSTKIVTTD
jgi:hypothetical protein